MDHSPEKTCRPETHVSEARRAAPGTRQNAWASYDIYNHITQSNVQGSLITNTPQTPIYDAGGNVSNDGRNQYVYDAEGRVCAVNSPFGMIGYVYDAEGNRTAKGTITSLSCDPTANGFTQLAGYVVGASGEQLTEIDANNQWAHTNVWAGGKLIATYDTQGLHFHIDDPLGTRRAQTNASGVLEATYQSLPYGDGYATQSAPGFSDDPTENHFTGKERDIETGNDYMFARYYNSATGRFLSPDWSAKEDPVPYAKLDNPQSLNLYSYVLNNPVGRADADGHNPWDFVAGAVGGVLNVIPQTINLINSGGNAALALAGASYRIPMMDEIQPDAHASAGGMAVGQAAQIMVPVGDMTEGAQLLKGAETGAAKSGAISMTEAVDKAAAHVDGGVMEETGKGTNYQFRNTTTDASGNTVSKMGRFDVNPADPHVAQEGAHLNLETHVNGKSVGNKHIPIDPKTVRPGDTP